VTHPFIVLPRQFEGLTLSKVAADVVNCSPNGLPPEIVIDFAKLGFIRPSAVVFLSNLIWWLLHRDTKVHLSGADARAVPGKAESGIPMLARIRFKLTTGEASMDGEAVFGGPA
jgi:hypothetical protein